MSDNTHDTTGPEPTAAKTPFLRRTWVKITGAAVAAVLLLGVGFGTGWAASSSRIPAGGPAVWSQEGNAPARPGDGSGPGRGPDGGWRDGGRGGPGQGADPRGDHDDFDTDSGTQSDGS